VAPHSTVGSVVTVTDDTFNETVLASDRPVVVDAWAPRCPPCAVIAKSLAELAGEFGDRLVIAALNADENPTTVLRYGVRAIPTLLLFRGGEVVGTLVGARPKSALREMLGAHG
jgi:thioredoxin 1